MPVRYLVPISGSYQVFPGGALTAVSRAYTEYQNLTQSNSNGDHVTPNLFNVNRVGITGGVFNGVNGSTASSYTVYANRDDRIYDHTTTLFTNPVPSGLANRLFANTTPDRADVLLPTAVFELKELPMAIYHAGRKLLKGRQPPPRIPKKPGVTQASADWVALNFGWAPLIGDLKKLSQFSDLAAKRNKEFDRLYSGSGLLRRMTLHESSREVELVYSSRIPFSESMRAKGTCVQTIWGTCRWRPSGYGTGSMKPRPTPDYVKRAVLGLNAVNITSNIWEALPWSWFVDYFFHVQDFLVANAGLRTAVPGAASIMMKHYTHCVAPAKSLTDSQGRVVTRSGGHHVSEQKNRTIAYPSGISAGFPILSGKQLSILGALAVLKRPR